MAVFKVSGYGDWEVTEAGEKLCQNFTKDNPRKKKPKKNKTNIDKKLDSKIDKIGKTGLLKRIRNNITKHADDRIPLNSELNSSHEDEHHTFSKPKIRKRGIKRKRSSTSLHDNKQPKTAVNHNNGSTNIIQPKAQVKTNSKKLIKEQAIINTIKKKTSHDKIDPKQLKKRKMQLEKLQRLLADKERAKKKEVPTLTLRQNMMRKLKAARFRFLNEQIYNTTSKEAEKIFRRDPEAFKAYHDGYKLQIKRWPLNPLDKIIKAINKMDKKCVIADFGCGEARLAKLVEQKVHSFDLVAVNETVTVCDMAHVPLPDSAVDVAVFCLSLMGTNLKDYLREANRVLKKGGLLKIAEVESRFEDVNVFIKGCEQFGFKKTWMDLSYNLFYFIDFRKETNINVKKKLPTITLQPCLYKKR